MNRIAILSALLATCILTPAFAQSSSSSSSSSSSGGGQCTGAQAFSDRVAKSESAGSGNYSAVNGSYYGRYQMGQSALVEAGYMSRGGQFNGTNGVNSWNDFLSNPTAQDDAYGKYLQSNWKQVKAFGLDQYVGQKLPNGETITESGLMMSMQFGNVRVRNYFSGGMQCTAASSDGNGTCVGTYISRGNGIDISSITGTNSTGAGGGSCSNNNQQDQKQADNNLDKTSKTCQPTIPMLQAIPCEKYPAALQGFCQRYKPLQMNMGDCQKAEKFAENAAKGNRENECSQQTFRRGTSAWSFVLACSFAKTDQGQTGNGEEAKNNYSKYAKNGGSGGGTGGTGGTGGGGTGGTVTGAADDPKCVERLKAKVPDIKVLGQISIGSYNGSACTVPSAVRYRGKAVDFGSELTMDCSLAEQWENFGEAAKGIGLTKIKSLGTLSCRGQTTSGSKLSAHAVGKAIDVSIFYGSTTGDTSQYFSNPSVKQYLQGQMLPIACQKFRGVLGPVFYVNRGGYKHYHFDSRDKGTTECGAIGVKAGVQ